MRYVYSTQTSEVTPVTIWYICSLHHGHTSRYHGWITSVLFVPSQSAVHKATSDSDPENSSWRSSVWSKGKVIQSTQYPINSLPFHFTSIRQQLLRYSYFDIWPWNILVKVMSDVKGQVRILYPVSNRFPSLSFNIYYLFPQIMQFLC